MQNGADRSRPGWERPCRIGKSISRHNRSVGARRRIETTHRCCNPRCPRISGCRVHRRKWRGARRKAAECQGKKMQPRRGPPTVIAAYLPEPLAPGTEPDLAYVAFSRWWSLWDNQPEMAFTHPEPRRTSFGIGIGKPWRGECPLWLEPLGRQGNAEILSLRDRRTPAARPPRDPRRLSFQLGV